MTEKILADYAPTDAAALSQEDYTNYKVTKNAESTNLQLDIKYEEMVILKLEEISLEQTMESAKLKDEVGFEILQFGDFCFVTRCFIVCLIT